MDGFFNFYLSLAQTYEIYKVSGKHGKNWSQQSGSKYFTY